MNVYNSQKYVEIWLSKSDFHANILETLKPLFKEYHEKKYRVAVFESGTQDLFENTKDLLIHAMEVRVPKESDEPEL